MLNPRKPTIWFLACFACLAFVLAGCSVMEEIGDGIHDALPASNGDVADLEAQQSQGMSNAIAGAVSGNLPRTIAGALSALFGAIGLSRLRRREEIKIVKAAKKVEKVKKIEEIAAKADVVA